MNILFPSEYLYNEIKAILKTNENKTVNAKILNRLRKDIKRDQRIADQYMIDADRHMKSSALQRDIAEHSHQ